MILTKELSQIKKVEKLEEIYETAFMTLKEIANINDKKTFTLAKVKSASKLTNLLA